ncbi:phage holin family protein, partial [Salipiger sp. PrR007]|uniref:phage holin family protein n=1 Tax=Salipiger sp. PrR007 TaxID=2706884 RepID=UPI0013B6B59F
AQGKVLPLRAIRPSRPVDSGQLVTLTLVAALIMIKGGMSKLKASSLAPTRTTENVRRDVSAIRETTNG